MFKGHGALLFIASDSANGLEGLKRLVSKIISFSKITGTSSVYKRFLEFGIENFNSELVMALRIEINLSQAELQDTLNQISSGIYLLAFDQEVNLLPGKNLPHSDLHGDPLTLRCAAEAWGTYEHPVLGQTLNEIVRSDDKFEKVEFFAQGRAVLDLALGEVL